ncbi:hypothetical protein [Streptomyces sp. HUAS TT7]|uniref:hypothetical protein n=1 Tax=Streptomyces sp. HUAS TT7 TaxID=3447507 RepID=UPI003F65EEE0
MTLDEASQASVHIPDLLGELADPARQQTQLDPRGLQHPHFTSLFRAARVLFRAARVGEPSAGPPAQYGSRRVLGIERI